MNLHIFNPEHEIALADGGRHPNYGHNVREMRMNLGWLPALWAHSGDIVLVDDAAYAVKACAGYRHDGNEKTAAGIASCKRIHMADVLFLETSDIRGQHFDNVIPWGWDLALTTSLADARINADNIPDDNKIKEIKTAASRQRTTDALKEIRYGIEERTCGEAVYLTSAEDLSAIGRKVVVKSPWSSSGRGVRYIETGNVSDNTRRWINNVIRRQGGIMAEPYYNKVKDFAMEFHITDGVTEYCGLSLFHTYNGGYAGNLITTEKEKIRKLERYLSAGLIEDVKRRICDYADRHLARIYDGPFGVDMMIVGDGAFLLHPCVEINLRRTMGHVALSLPASDALPDRVMKIEHNVNYRIKISEPENNFVQTL